MLVGLKEMATKKKEQLLNSSLSGQYEDKDIRAYSIELATIERIINYIENYDS